MLPFSQIMTQLGQQDTFMYDPVKTKMAGGMNLMMSGNVFVYYGEELGMSGAGKDENKRAPMYWFMIIRRMV